MLKNKICIVTGSSSGIGNGVAIRLAKTGAIPILLSRQNDRGQRAFQNLQSINNRVEWIPCDLSSQNSVRKFAEIFKNKFNTCDYLFLCAGVQYMKRQINDENLELMFATNYLGHFLLTNLLFDELSNAPFSRVIVVSGSSHKASALEGLNTGTINFSDLQGEIKFNFANQSKQGVLAKILLTYELARRWEKYNISACTLSPGLVKTNLTNNLPWYVRFIFNLRCILGKAPEPEEAASYLLELCTKDSINGKYYEADTGVLLEVRSSDESYNTDIAKQLWEISENLVGESFSY